MFLTLTLPFTKQSHSIITIPPGTFMADETAGDKLQVTGGTLIFCFVFVVLVLLFAHVQRFSVSSMEIFLCYLSMINTI